MSDMHDPRSGDEMLKAALGELPDSPMPEQVSRRLEGVIAGFTSTGQDAREAGAQGAQAAGAQEADAPVIPMPRPGGSHAAARSGVPRWLLPALGGAAAVMMGALVISSVGLGGSSGGSDGDVSAAEPRTSSSPSIELAALPARRSGTNYSAAQLDEQARALASGAMAGAEAYSPGPTLYDCVNQLTDGRPETVLAIDDASYEGDKAIVVVNSFPGVEDTIDVWVVGPSCSKADAALITFRRITP